MNTECLTSVTKTDEELVQAEKVTCESLKDMNNRLEPEQKTVLSLLKEIDEICRRNNITYYASAGTALGAVRHNGFIPWDDDADIHITRDNFHKLINLPESEFPPNRKIISWETEEDYNYSIARYINTKSTVLYKHNAVRNYPSGVMIDLIILEPMPADPAKWQKHMDLLQIWNDYHNPEVCASHRWWGKSYYTRYALMDKLMGRKRFLKYLEKRLFCEPDDENTTAYHQRMASVPWIYPKDFFREPKWLPFEDMMLAVPTDVEGFLSQCYSDDWMLIPPAVDRYVHDNIEHTELPSSVFVRDFRPFLNNRKKVMSVFEKRASHLAKHRVFRGNFLKGNFYFHTKKIHYSFEQKLQEDGRTLEQIILEKDYQALETILEQYNLIQYNVLCIGGRTFAAWYRRNNPILLDLPDELHYAGLLLALHKEQLFKADRLLVARYASSEPVPEYIAELRGLVDDLKGAISAYLHKDYAKAKELTKKWLEKFPDNLSLIRLDAAADFELMTEEAQQRELLERTKAALEEYPTDDVLRFITAELLSAPWKQAEGDAVEKVITTVIPAEEEGEEDQILEESLNASEYAQYLLESLYDTCSNGFVLLTLRKRLEKAAAEDSENMEIVKKLWKVYERTGVCFKNIEFPEDPIETAEETAEEQIPVDENDRLLKVLMDKFPEDSDTYDMLKKLFDHMNLHIRDFEFEETKQEEEAEPEGDEVAEQSKSSGGELVDDGSAEANVPIAQAEEHEAHDANDEAAAEAAEQEEEIVLRSYKEVCLTLLREIDEICIKNGIPYYVTHAAAVAVGKNFKRLPESFAKPRVAMYVEDFLRFKTALAAEKLEDRKLDCMMSNPNFPNFGARYTDETTLHYPVQRHKFYASRGIAVEIDFIRSKNYSRKAKLVYALEQAWEYMHVKATGYRKVVVLISAMLRAASVVVGKKCLAKMIFKLCTKASVFGKSQNCFIRTIDAKTKIRTFPCKVFGTPQRKPLDGRNLSFPRQLGKYLRKLSSEWRKLPVGGGGTDRFNIKDPNMPYAKYEALLDTKIVNDRWRNMMHLNKIDIKKDQLVDKVKDFWYIMLRSEARIRLWQKYEPLKAEIMELSAEADARTAKVKKAEKQNVLEEVMEVLLGQQAEIYGQLEEILQDYNDEIKRFARRKMGLCFDKDIMDVMVKVMRYQGRNKAADKLLRRTPKATYKAPDLSF